jgi:hypothetical protein
MNTMDFQVGAQLQIHTNLQ